MKLPSATGIKPPAAQAVRVTPVPAIKPVHVPGPVKGAARAPGLSPPVFDKAVQVSGEERPRSVFRPIKTEGKIPHWSGK